MRTLVFVASIFLCGVVQAQNAAEQASANAAGIAQTHCRISQGQAEDRWQHAGQVNDSAVSDRAWAIQQGATPAQLAPGDAEHDLGDDDYALGAIKYNSADSIESDADVITLAGDILWADGQFAAAKTKYDIAKTKYNVAKAQYDQAYDLFSDAADHYNAAGAMWLTCWF